MRKEINLIRKETRIVYHESFVSVHKDPDCYAVFVPSASYTHSVFDSAYELSADGESLAIVRAKYLDKRGGR
jgi:hypothetical protein